LGKGGVVVQWGLGVAVTNPFLMTGRLFSLVITKLNIFAGRIVSNYVSVVLNVDMDDVVHGREK
jgi:hypothetical protein